MVRLAEVDAPPEKVAIGDAFNFGTLIDVSSLDPGDQIYLNVISRQDTNSTTSYTPEFIRVETEIPWEVLEYALYFDKHQSLTEEVDNAEFLRLPVRDTDGYYWIALAKTPNPIPGQIEYFKLAVGDVPSNIDLDADSTSDRSDFQLREAYTLWLRGDATAPYGSVSQPRREFLSAIPKKGRIQIIAHRYDVDGETWEKVGEKGELPCANTSSWDFIHYTDLGFEQEGVYNLTFVHRHRNRVSVLHTGPVLFANNDE